MPLIKARSSSIIDDIDLRGTPTAPTAIQATNTNQLASTSFVRTAIADLIDSSPNLLNTLNELAAALGDDPNFATTVANSIATKLPKDGTEAMTGELILSGDPSNVLGATTKQYVDNAINNITITSTDDVPEGTNNLYHTESRVRNAVSLSSDNQVVLSYDSSTGTFTYAHPTSDGILEGGTNQYFTETRARNSISLSSDDATIISYSPITGAITFTTPDTDQINEGLTNQYFTTARARNSISAGSNISYDSSTGIISSTAAVDSVNGQTGVVVLDTDDISEGSTNLYFTNARAAGAVSLVTDDSNVLSYSTGTGVFTFTKPNTDAISEGSVNQYFTNARARGAISVSGDLSYNSGTGVISYTTPNTDGVSEGSSNLYFTDARARNAVSHVDAGGDGSFSYDSTTGIFTYTGPSAADTRAHFSHVDAGGDGSFSYNNATGVFTYTGPSAAEARAHFNTTQPSGDGSLSYDSATGVFTYTGPDDADYRQAVSANAASGDGNLQYNSTTGVFTYDGPTNADYRGAVSATKVSGDGDLQYNSATGVFSYTGPSASEARAHFSHVDAGGDGSFSYNSATGVFTYTGPSAAEVRNHLDADPTTGITYDNSTGLFSLSGIPNASLTNSSVTVNGTAINLGGSGTLDTDDIGEGTTNLYYTDTRSRAAVSVSDPSGALTYNSTTGVFTFNISAGVSSVNGQTGAVVLDTDDIGEGTVNLYYTDTRARNSLVGGMGVTYISGTGEIAIGQPVGTTDNVTFNDVTVSGDLTVNGTLTTINSTNLTVTDKNIVIADGAANAAAANGAGITVDGANATITYVSGTDSWDLNKDVNVTGDVTATTFNGDLVGNVTGQVTDVSNHDTDDIAEGTNNLYYTDTRARNAISVSGDLTYNSGTGVIGFALSSHDTDDLSEGTSNLYYTDTRARNAVSHVDAGGDGSFSYDSTTGIFTYTGPSAAEARAHFGATKVSGDGNLTYDSATGVFSYTGPSASDTRVHFSAGNSGTGFGSLSYNSSTGAFTFAKVTASDIRGEVSATKVSGDGNFSYDSTTGLFSYTGPDDADYRTAVSGTKVSGDGNFSYDSTTGVFSYTGPSAADTRAHFSHVDAGGDGSFDYDSATGVFTYTGPSASEVRAHLSATTASGVTYDNSTGVIALASIPNSSLANDSITINGANIVLGGSDTLDTDDIGEGATNQYFTNTRARNAVSLTSDNQTALSYDTSTGVFTFSLSSIDTDEIAEGAVNFYFTTARARNAISAGANISYDSSTGVISSTSAVDSVNGQTGVVVLDTDDISEGSTNLYHTDGRARAAISITTDDANILDYNSGTGLITFVTPNTDAIAEGATNLYYTNNRADARIAAASVGDLNDVDLTGVQDGYTLVWSSTAGEFVPQNIATTASNHTFTGDGTTTSFSLGIEVSSILNTQVYVNGLLQAPTYSYTLSTTSGVTSVVFDVAPESSDYILVRAIATSQLTAGGVLNENSTVDGGSF